MSAAPQTLLRYLADVRAHTLEALRGFVPADTPFGPMLYDLALDYPLREAKALRPALCVAACRSLGGALEACLPTAAVLELYHNAFLIHDDIEDGSDLRRGANTLHREHGVPVAVNVGDAMLAMALPPLLANTRLVGLGRALTVLAEVSRMAQVSAEGQALELHWVRTADWSQTDADYELMVTLKTAEYTFVSPLVLGALLAGAAPGVVEGLRAFARPLGVAFQIQDDLLNLEADTGGYGKEASGDLWEGKHTLILIHALRTASPHERERALSILARPRPSLADGAERVAEVAAALAAEGALSASGLARLREALGAARIPKTAEEVAWLRERVETLGSLAYARAVARRHALDAEARWRDVREHLAPSEDRDALDAVAQFVIGRDR